MNPSRESVSGQYGNAALKVLPGEVAAAVNALLSQLALNYDRVHLNRAARALAGLARGGEVPDGTILRAGLQYAQDVLGSTSYAPWLWVYATSSGAFREGWIPDNYYGRWVVPLAQGLYGTVLGQRALPYLLFQGAHSPDLAYRINGRFLGTDLTLVDDSDFAEFLFSASDAVVMKRDRSSRGRGIQFLDRSGYDLDAIRSMGDVVFQRRLRHHRALDVFARDALSTLRLTTVIDAAGRAVLRTAQLRLPRRGETHVLSSNEIQIAVDPDTARLRPYGFCSDWTKVSSHPDTGEPFGGFAFPMFEDCRAAAENLHSRVPFVQCIGWDMAVDESGAPALLEVNATHNGIAYAEASTGPCFEGLAWERLCRAKGGLELSRSQRPEAWR